jgi:thioredoxin reductase (NADPH)
MPEQGPSAVRDESIETLTGTLIETDAVVIGAGPVGLFQVFELGLLDIRAHVIDALPYAGGQPVELYPDKPIYDIPGLPVCTGRELTERLLEQIRPFGAHFHLEQEVVQVRQEADDRFHVVTSNGTRFLTKTIFIAAGVGAFQPRPLKLGGLEKFDNTQLFYRVAAPSRFAGKRVVIVGGGDSALDWALYFVEHETHRALSVTLIHRRDSFQAAPATVSKVKALCERGEMAFLVGQVTDFEETGERLSAVEVTSPDEEKRVVPADVLLVFFGLSPRLGPIADWGLDIERKQLLVDTEKFSTNVPGIFAVGDINTYPGKKKLILSGFHECALAAFGAAPIIFPGKNVMLQYTTTSPRLHKALGVSPPSPD